MKVCTKPSVQSKEADSQKMVFALLFGQNRHIFREPAVAFQIRAGGGAVGNF